VRGDSTDYAFSMPKLGATATKTVQLEFANLLDFRGFRRVLLVRVRPEIALVTRWSSKGKGYWGLSNRSYFHCSALESKGLAKKSKFNSESYVIGHIAASCWAIPSKSLSLSVVFDHRCDAPPPAVLCLLDLDEHDRFRIRVRDFRDRSATLPNM
jgi:hypothetical protein